jgi:hypothetical protein
MKLNDTKGLRQLFAERKGWFTVDEISTGMGMSTRTISKAFGGGKLRPNTVKLLADAIQEKPTDIAHYTE